MKTVTIDHKNGHSTTYKIVESGTAYHIDTPQQVVDILERARERRQRLKFYYGDAKTGRDWGEESDKYGTVGRSSGTVKIPLVIHSCRSHGGCSLLDHCLVKIKDVQTGRVLYQHELYKPLVMELIPSDLPEYSHAVKVNGQLYSRHRSKQAANFLINKLS